MKSSVLVFYTHCITDLIGEKFQHLGIVCQCPVCQVIRRMEKQLAEDKPE